MKLLCQLQDIAPVGGVFKLAGDDDPGFDLPDLQDHVIDIRLPEPGLRFDVFGVGPGARLPIFKCFGVRAPRRARFDRRQGFAIHAIHMDGAAGIPGRAGYGLVDRREHEFGRDICCRARQVKMPADIIAVHLDLVDRLMGAG